MGLLVGLRLLSAERDSAPENVRGCVKTTASGLAIRGVVFSKGLVLLEGDLEAGDIGEEEAGEDTVGGESAAVFSCDVTTFGVGDETGGVTVDGDDTAIFEVGETIR